VSEQKFNPDSPEPKTFGELLRRTRRQAGKTMGDVAKELSWLPVTKLSAIEVGDEPPPAALVVKKLAEVIGVDPQPWLLMAERGREEWKARQQVPAPLPAAGPWRYDEPPKNGRLVLAIFEAKPVSEGLDIVFYCATPFTEGWQSQIHPNIFYLEHPICWAEINMPEVEG
jgi:hypothetical protein